MATSVQVEHAKETPNQSEHPNESGKDSVSDGSGVSLSVSAYDVIQQYSEAELHGEYEEQYFGFTADSVADNCKLRNCITG